MQRGLTCLLQRHPVDRMLRPGLGITDDVRKPRTKFFRRLMYSQPCRIRFLYLHIRIKNIGYLVLLSVETD